MSSTDPLVDVTSIGKDGLEHIAEKAVSSKPVLFSINVFLPEEKIGFRWKEKQGYGESVEIHRV